MDRQGFRIKLQGYGLVPPEISNAIVLIEHFDEFLQMPGQSPSRETTWEYSQLLISRQMNTTENYITLIRYCAYIQEREMQVAFLELVDGGEVSENLYQKVATQFGEVLRDEVFDGIGIAPYGIGTPQKPAYVHPVIQRMNQKLGTNTVCQFLSGCMRDLPDEMYDDDIQMFFETGNIDDFITKRKEKFLNKLEKCMQQGKLFFAQEITPEVLAFVRSEPEIGGGKRVGQVIYETKIPFMTREFLEEEDPLMRRYYYCHCPWTREAIRRGNVSIAENFCYCSGGFHKKLWELIYECPLKVEVLESVAWGNDCCRFAIHLPDNVIPNPLIIG